MMKIKSLSILIISFFLMFSCGKKETTTPNGTNTDTEQNDSSDIEDYLLMEVTKVGIPGFDISIDFSEKAYQKLHEANESVIASLAFTSDSFDSSELPKSLKKFDEINGLNLGVFDFETEEITNPMVIHAENMSFSKELYEVLNNKDINLNVNVYSGRKSSEDNLIKDGNFDGKFSRILKAEGLNLKVKLIGENDEE